MLPILRSVLSALCVCWFSDFVPTYLIDYSFWPVVQGINFHFVPVRHQLLVVNSMCYFDDIFLTYVQVRVETRRDQSGAEQTDATRRDATRGLANCRGAAAAAAAKGSWQSSA